MPAQIVAEHRTYLNRLLTGFLLSKRVGALRRLIELKALATQFAALSGRLAIDTEALELDTVDVVTGATVGSGHGRLNQSSTAPLSRV